MPAAPVTSNRFAPVLTAPLLECTETAPLFGHVSQDPDVRVVADEEAVGARLAQFLPRDAYIAAEQRGLHAPLQAAHRRAGQEDRVLDLGLLDEAVLRDRGVGPDVGVDEARARADDRGPADRRALEHGAGLEDDAPVALRVDELAVDARLDAVEHEPVRLQHVLEPAGVLPPTLHDVRLDDLARVH